MGWICLNSDLCVKEIGREESGDELVRHWSFVDPPKNQPKNTHIIHLQYERSSGLCRINPKTVWKVQGIERIVVDRWGSWRWKKFGCFRVGVRMGIKGEGEEEKKVEVDSLIGGIWSVEGRCEKWGVMLFVVDFSIKLLISKFSRKKLRIWSNV